METLYTLRHKETGLTPRLVHNPKVKRTSKKRFFISWANPNTPFSQFDTEEALIQHLYHIIHKGFADVLNDCEVAAYEVVIEHKPIEVKPLHHFQDLASQELLANKLKGYI